MLYFWLFKVWSVAVFKFRLYYLSRKRLFYVLVLLVLLLRNLLLFHFGCKFTFIREKQFFRFGAIITRDAWLRCAQRSPFGFLFLQVQILLTLLTFLTFRLLFFREPIVWDRFHLLHESRRFSSHFCHRIRISYVGFFKVVLVRIAIK